MGQRGTHRSRVNTRVPLLLALCVLALGLPARPASAADALDALLQAIGSKPHAHATFVEHQYLKILDRPLESSGELLFAAPDRLEKRTVAPRPESLKVEDGQLTLERGRHHLNVALASYPQVAPLIEGIRATLAGDRVTLDRLFSIEFTTDGDAWSMRLLPRDADLSRLVRLLRLEGQGGELRQVETLRGDGDRSVMDITPAGDP
jgi:hypothetical protein